MLNIVECFKHRHFASWAKAEKISDADLKTAISEIHAGLVDADLGNGLVKKRIARKGQGKRSGYRVLLAFRHEHRAFFVYGFAKNQRENITAKEQRVYKNLAEIYLSLDKSEIKKLIKSGEIIEVK